MLPRLLHKTNKLISSTFFQPYLISANKQRRAMRFNRSYHWKKIDQTPFTVVVTFPEYAQNQIQIPEHEVNAMMRGGKILSKYFQGNYRIHPDWIYCRSIKKNFEDIKLGDIDPDDCEMTPEEELEYFIEKFEKASWKWRTAKNEKGAYKCDQKLIQALLYDAKVTAEYPYDPKNFKTSYHKKYDIHSTFVSTHSGLLRYKLFEEDELINKRLSERFGEMYKNSIDEDWYKHAVEFNKRDPKAFVYSLPFDARYQTNPLVTVASTIYATDAGGKAPAAVVGFQFPQHQLEKLFGEKVCVTFSDSVWKFS